MRVCDKCFASVQASDAFCPDCGAPLNNDGKLAEGSDAAMYPELAKANLHRMRGEWKAAEDVCLTILKRYPNNATANALLGDICAERGDLDQAVEWYELALDLVPDSGPVADKLASVRQRMREKEVASTAEQIGLPNPSTSVRPWHVVAAILLLVLVGLGAFFAGRRSEAPVVRDSIELGSVDQPAAPAPSETAEPEDSPPAAAPGGAWRDAALFENLKRSIPDGDRLLDAWQDPRTMAVMVSFTTSPEEARVYAARIGSSTLERLPAAPKVVLRAIGGSQLVLVGEVTRDRVMQTANQDWQVANGGNVEAWVAAVLGDVWAPSLQASPPEASVQGSANGLEPGSLPGQ